MFENFEEMINCFPTLRNLKKEDCMELKTFVSDLSVGQSYSLNTMTELLEAFEFFKKEDVGFIILISSATHAPRCLRDASTVLTKMNTNPFNETNLSYHQWNPIILATSATNCYADSIAEDVLIIEPPHLPEDYLGEHKLLRSRNSLIRKLLSIKRNKLQSLTTDLQDLIDKYS